MGREMSGFEAFCAGFQISSQGFNGEIFADQGIDVSRAPDIQASWEEICKNSGMDPKVRNEMISQLADYIAQIQDAKYLNSAWVKLYTGSGELLGQISPRHLLVDLLGEVYLIDLHTENGSEPVDISDTARLEFYVG